MKGKTVYVTVETFGGNIENVSVFEKENDKVAGAVVESVVKFGIPKFLHQHETREPIGVFKEIFQRTGKECLNFSVTYGWFLF